MSDATDQRYDWEYRAICPEGGEDHIELEGEATNTIYDPREALPLEQCPVCGAEVDIETDQRPAESEVA